MARSKRFLILLAVLAAACAAAAIALNWQQRQEQIQTSGEAVLEIDPDSVQALSWTRGNSPCPLPGTRRGIGAMTTTTPSR